MAYPREGTGGDDWRGREEDDPQEGWRPYPGGLAQLERDIERWKDLTVTKEEKR